MFTETEGMKSVNICFERKKKKKENERGQEKEKKTRKKEGNNKGVNRLL
jgi:hypothetical protein